ncbi:hypothetical protein N7I30_11980 [Aurantimonas litoralis]|nr:hypothetical protein [Aurantimonas litoralis]
MSSTQSPVAVDRDVDRSLLRLAAALATVTFLMPSIVAVAFQIFVILRLEDPGPVSLALAGVASIESGSFSFITQYWAALPALIAGAIAATSYGGKSAPGIVILVTTLSILISSYELDFLMGLKPHEVRGFAALLSGSMTENIRNIDSLIAMLATVKAISVGFLAAAAGAYLVQKKS